MKPPSFLFMGADLLNHAVQTRRRCAAARRRGVMLPFVAVILPVLIMFLGFSVDLAYMQHTRGELRAATDAATRAAATKLSITDSQSEATTEALDIAAENLVAGDPLRLDPGNIEYGVSRRKPNGRWVFTPGGRDPNAVRITAGESRTVPLYFGRLIGLSGFQPVSTATASFPGTDICLVLDRSTSMKVDVDSTQPGMYTSDPRFCQPPTATSRWTALAGAVQVFTDTLRSNNAMARVGVATYSSALVSTYCGMSTQASSLDLQLSSDLGLVDARIDDLSSSVWNGNTDIESGIQTGLQELVNGQNARDWADRYLIVMTDGNQNVGNAERAAEQAARQGVTIHTVTFSIDANQDLMRSVAAIAGGRHLHANTPEELRNAFRDLATQTAQLTE